ncbi:glycyl-radical enzyme activating protein [Clostridium pasteurianum]|uniref:Glycyl-radical enzyme activator family protein n=1 Tax=Clostridium pasteurianum BC1 TaxID=86416 RepID=R4K7M6_CLOPA|nr:glycyl-radical enzyme activating protein [Clostridium pasteurianum]AGK95645.1 glycyl-radical enzyme activator family protein [Clostridium pasteurianum BC1]
MENIKACIFNIQKYSIHDGPGIRTVVFFKSCPLKCLWCSNPESQNSIQQITWDKSKCLKCLRCVHNCEHNAISLNNNLIEIDSRKCVSCFRCVKSCPKKSLIIEGKYLTLSEVMEDIIKDNVFYQESNGGVTLSGGEVLEQYEFATELLKLLKENNIHTAIETTGYTSNEIFSDFIKSVDLLLFDVKHYDREKHFKTTNVYNDVIIENLRIAVEKDKDVIIRIPVIPTINSSLEDAKGFCTLLKSIGATKINLLPFHQFGQKKYELLNKYYSFKNIEQLHEEDLLEYQKIFIENGFNCYF